MSRIKELQNFIDRHIVRQCYLLEKLIKEKDLDTINKLVDKANTSGFYPEVVVNVWIVSESLAQILESMGRLVWVSEKEYYWVNAEPGELITTQTLRQAFKIHYTNLLNM